VNGFSTSLPEEIQYEGLRTIAGLENVRMIRAGYAVEYDFFPPHQLKHTLETKLINGLYFAGQINGTSGYEEAAGQGLIAGINAALKVQGRAPFVMKRSDGYIGVMIDDLINKSTDEPYRMFTSRAEYRLLLRQDNADRRLMRAGNAFGLIPYDMIEKLDDRERRIEKAIGYLRSTTVSPSTINPLLENNNESLITENESLLKITRRSNITVEDVAGLIDDEEVRSLFRDNKIKQQVEIDVKYEGYIRRQQEQIARFEKMEEHQIPDGFDYERISSLSAEGKEKLKKIRPRSIGQATRIAGVTNADVSVLSIFLNQYHNSST
jgi:tRNA uridine 5-carboxymethylaminomethyl modification enzyme